jgi:hypothetical protein
VLYDGQKQRLIYGTSAPSSTIALTTFPGNWALTVVRRRQALHALQYCTVQTPIHVPLQSERRTCHLRGARSAIFSPVQVQGFFFFLPWTHDWSLLHGGRKRDGTGVPTLLLPTPRKNEQFPSIVRCPLGARGRVNLWLGGAWSRACGGGGVRRLLPWGTTITISSMALNVCSSVPRAFQEVDPSGFKLPRLKHVHAAYSIPTDSSQLLDREVKPTACGTP